MEVQHPPRLLITRPAAQAQRFARSVEAAMPGLWRITSAPLIAIEHRQAPPDLSGVTQLIFSSANGVTAFAALSDCRLPAICVGERTAAVARKAGFPARAIGRSVAELVEAVGRMPETGEFFLHAHAAHVTSDLSTELARLGLSARSAVVYDQHPIDLPGPVSRDLAAGDFRAVPLFSPRTAVLLGVQLGKASLPDGTVLVCLSPQVAEAARGFAGPVVVTPEPTAAAMRDALKQVAGTR